MATKQNPYARQDRELCWLCERNPADSREHSIKATRIKAELDKLEPGNFLLAPGKKGKYHPIRGKGSKVVQFGQTMCARCNNERTKPFDLAYDRFITFALENYDYFRDKRQFSWSDIFAGCDFDQRHLQRYYLKNAACRMIDAGVEKVPEELRNYLLDLDCLPCFDLILYKDYESADKFMQIENIASWMSEGEMPDEMPVIKPFTNPFANAAIGNADGGPFMPGDVPFGFSSVLQDGPVGALFRWEHPSVRHSQLISFNHTDLAFIRDRKELPEDVQELTGGWDVYVEVIDSATELVQLKKQSDQLQERKRNLSKKSLAKQAVLRFRVRQVKSTISKAILRTEQSIEAYKEQVNQNWL